MEGMIFNESFCIGKCSLVTQTLTLEHYRVFLFALFDDIDKKQFTTGVLGIPRPACRGLLTSARFHQHREHFGP